MLAPTRDDAPPASGAIANNTSQVSPHRTVPICLSVSLKRVLLDQFTPDALRNLASLIEDEQPGMVARLRLSNASIEELAAMLTSGRKPTLGWWRRNAA